MDVGRIAPEVVWSPSAAVRNRCETGVTVLRSCTASPLSLLRRRESWRPTTDERTPSLPDHIALCHHRLCQHHKGRHRHVSRITTRRSSSCYPPSRPPNLGHAVGGPALCQHTGPRQAASTDRAGTARVRPGVGPVPSKSPAWGLCRHATPQVGHNRGGWMPRGTSPGEVHAMWVGVVEPGPRDDAPSGSTGQRRHDCVRATQHTLVCQSCQACVEAGPGHTRAAANGRKMPQNAMCVLLACALALQGAGGDWQEGAGCRWP